MEVKFSIGMGLECQQDGMVIVCVRLEYVIEYIEDKFKNLYLIRKARGKIVDVL